MAKVLVADDEHAICEAFAELLIREGHTPLIASSGQEAVSLVNTEEPEVVFVDVQMVNMTGLEALDRIHASHPDLPVIVMTAHGTMHTAIEAMRGGAFDYLGKPLELPQIRLLLEHALHRPKIAKERPDQSGTAIASDQPVGTSPAMQEIFKMMGLLTTNDLTVLITGESGVGKELVARGIHVNGPKRDQPFVAVNCAAIPQHLMESELFGYEKGAFTGANTRRIGRFEMAARGTLFLDEIFELPFHLQGKLLRVLQEKSFERLGSSQPIPLQARVIAVTNRNLGADLDAQTVREDMYYRLSPVNLNIPPLRERRGDIPALVRHFLSRANAELGKTVEDIEEAAIDVLAKRSWPGNVRELEHTIKRSALVARGKVLTVHDLKFDDVASAHAPPKAIPLAQLEESAKIALRSIAAEQDDHGSALKRLTLAVERALIDEAMKLNDGNQVAASKLLGLSRTTLRKKR